MAQNFSTNFLSRCYHMFPQIRQTSSLARSKTYHIYIYIYHIYLVYVVIYICYRAFCDSTHGERLSTARLPIGEDGCCRNSECGWWNTIYKCVLCVYIYSQLIPLNTESAIFLAASSYTCFVGELNPNTLSEKNEVCATIMWYMMKLWF